MSSRIQEHFAPLVAPRVAGRTLHSFLDIIVLTIAAVASGVGGAAVMTTIRQLCINLFQRKVLHCVWLRKKERPHGAILTGLKYCSTHTFDAVALGF